MVFPIEGSRCSVKASELPRGVKSPALLVSPFLWNKRDTGPGYGSLTSSSINKKCVVSCFHTISRPKTREQSSDNLLARLAFFSYASCWAGLFAGSLCNYSTQMVRLQGESNRNHCLPGLPPSCHLPVFRRRRKPPPAAVGRAEQLQWDGPSANLLSGQFSTSTQPFGVVPSLRLIRTINGDLFLILAMCLHHIIMVLLMVWL